MESPSSSPRPFGRLPDGSALELHTVEIPGLRMEVTNFGGAIVSLHVPDRTGKLADVVLGYDDGAGYLKGNSFFGAIIGRYGNRIAKGRFVLDGKEYQLPINNGENHLHGGPEGFDRRVWHATALGTVAAPGLRLTRESPAGEEGYPGTLQVKVDYTLSLPGSLRIEYTASTDAPTPVNLTNHSYFNLAGHAAGPILDHQLSISATRFTPVDGGLIPTGELRPVRGTPFDFVEPHRVGERIDASERQIGLGPGYDHNFVLDRVIGSELGLAARVYEPGSGRLMEVLTTEPAIQFYSGNFLDGSQVGKGGVPYPYRGGFCLETQHFPDSPNHSAFPSVIVRPGETYHSVTVYRFSVQ